MHHTGPPAKQARSLPRNQVKTVMDAWNGYHSIPFRVEDQDKTTFLTEEGRYRYCRAPMGFLASGDAYTHRYDLIVLGIPRLTCSQVKKTSLSQLCLNITTRVSTNELNKKHDVGDPCLTPMAAVITAVPKILFVTLYMAPMAKSVIKPHPRRFKIPNSLFLGTRSWALEKSTYATKSFHLFLAHISTIRQRVKICSMQLLLGWARACSLCGVNHCDNR